MDKRRLIFDMDADERHLSALMYALNASELDVLGVVTGHSFYQPETAAKRIEEVLEKMGVTLPVICGAQRPLMRFNMDRALERPEAGTIQGSEAWDWMYDTLCKSSSKVTICLLGTATNLMQLLHKYPDAKEMIEEVFFVGGAFSFGTLNASACHKVYFDAEAMQFLMHSGIPFRMATVDVLSGYGNSAESADMGNAMAMVALTHDDLFHWGKVKCEVDLHGRLTYGMTVIYRNHYDGIKVLETGEKIRMDVPEERKNVWDLQPFDREAVRWIVEERLGRKQGGNR
jgi:inosine-uridine nucleoside N-ribohydrolase